MRSLYDVNCLIALLDRNHDDHATVSAWFTNNSEIGWASCPMTQNGCLRILAQPQYPRPLNLAAAMDLLRVAVSSPHHLFIADDISILDTTLVNTTNLTGHRQLTDAYLLALAVAHDARLVTLDTRIPMDAVIGATEDHLVVI